jgi:uncharacterized protein YciI
MKKIFLFVFLISCVACCKAQTANSNYDKALADSLGGDDYGMKNYILVILKTGSKKIDKKETEDSLFRGHMDNIIRLASLKKLVLAGPLAKNDRSYEGIFVLDAKTPEEANALLATDPAIQAGVIEAELYRWYGSAALPEYLKIHDRIQKKRF